MKRHPLGKGNEQLCGDVILQELRVLLAQALFEKEKPKRWLLGGEQMDLLLDFLCYLFNPGDPPEGMVLTGEVEVMGLPCGVAGQGIIGLQVATDEEFDSGDPE